MGQNENHENRIGLENILKLRHFIPSYGYYKIIRDMVKIEKEGQRIDTGSLEYMPLHGLYHVATTAASGFGIYKLVEFLF